MTFKEFIDSGCPEGAVVTGHCIMCWDGHVQKSSGCSHCNYTGETASSESYLNAVRHAPCRDSGNWLERAFANIKPSNPKEKTDDA